MKESCIRNLLCTRSRFPNWTGDWRKIIRQHGARIISAEPEFVVLELTGHKDQTQELLEILKEYELAGICPKRQSGSRQKNVNYRQFRQIIPIKPGPKAFSNLLIPILTKTQTQESADSIGQLKIKNSNP